MELLKDISERYEVEAKIGVGGTGEVYRVRRRVDSARFALKVFRVQGDGAREAREVQASLVLSHPHVIPCYEGGVQEGQGYLLLELAEGSMQESIAQLGRLPQNWQGLIEASRGVAYLHQQGQIHRDLKPANLLRVGTTIKVADMGMHRDTGMKTLTEEGLILGTPGYIAPEHILGDRITPAADTFALGVMFYQALEGHMPIEETETFEVVRRTAQGVFLPFRRAREILDADTVRELESMLSLDPKERPQDLAKLADRLAQVEGLGAASALFDRKQLQSRAKQSATTQTLDATSLEAGPESLRTFLHRRSSWFLGPLLLGCALLGWGLYPGPRVAPLPSEPRSVSPELPAGFSTRDFDALSEELSQLEGVWIDAEGNRSSKRTSAYGSNRILDADSEHWPLVYESSPTLQKFRTWLVSGGTLESLSPEHQERLASVDRYYESLEMMGPFQPYWKLQPERGPAQTFALGDSYDLEASEPTWCGALLALKERLTQRAEALKSRSWDEVERILPASYSPFLKINEGLGMNPAFSPYRFYEAAFSGLHGRQAWFHLNRQEVYDLARYLNLATRSLAEEPSMRRVVLAQSYESLPIWSFFFASPLAFDPALFPPEGTPGTGLEVLEILVETHQAQIRFKSGSFSSEEALAPHLDLRWEEAFEEFRALLGEDPASQRLSRQIVYRWLQQVLGYGPKLERLDRLFQVAFPGEAWDKEGYLGSLSTVVGFLERRQVRGLPLQLETLAWVERALTKDFTHPENQNRKALLIARHQKLASQSSLEAEAPGP